MGENAHRFTVLYTVFSQKVIKRLCCHSIGAFKGVYIDVRGCNIGVTKSRRNSFYIAAVGKEHGCACVAKPVEFQVTDAVALQEVIKLLGRRLRIHHIAVLLGEHIVEISPTVAKVGNMAVLLQTVLG